MIRTYIYLLLIIVSFISCSGSNEYTLTGKLHIDGFDGRMVYMCRMNDDLTTFTDIDSTRIVGDTFHFKGMSSDTVVGYHVFIGKEEVDRINHSRLTFIPEKGHIKIKLDEDYFGFVMGTPQNDRLGELMQLKQRLNVRTLDIRDSLMAIDPEETQSRMPEELQVLTQQMNNEVYCYLKGLTGTLFLDEMFFEFGGYLNEEQVGELIGFTSNRVLNRSAAQEKARREEGKALIGEPFLELHVLDANDKEVELSSYVGRSKVTLIDFWASWCGPCINEIPILKAIYDKYKDAGFEIVTISLDTGTDKWKKALKENPMEWPQFISKAGKEGAGFIYGIRSIPYTILIDESGIVLAKNIRGYELDAELEKLLK